MTVSTRGFLRVPAGGAACLLLTAAAAVLSPLSAHAVPFDAVVPQEIQIDTTVPSNGVQFEYWGWIVAATDTIEAEDLNAAVISVEIEGTAVTVDQTGFKNSGMFSPLIPGEVAGFRLDPENAAAYDSLLTGETLKAPSTSFWTTVFDYPTGLVDTLIVSGSIVMNGDELSYTTTVYFGAYSSLPVVALGQRIPSTPIPVLVRNTTWGNLKSRYLHRDP